MSLVGTPGVSWPITGGQAPCLTGAPSPLAHVHRPRPMCICHRNPFTRPSSPSTAPIGDLPCRLFTPLVWPGPLPGAIPPAWMMPQRPRMEICPPTALPQPQAQLHLPQHSPHPPQQLPHIPDWGPPLSPVVTPMAKDGGLPPTALLTPTALPRPEAHLNLFTHPGGRCTALMVNLLHPLPTSLVWAGPLLGTRPHLRLFPRWQRKTERCPPRRTPRPVRWPPRDP